MTTKTLYVRCHAISRASINEWVKMQQQERPKLSIHFKDHNTTVYLLDKIEDKGIKLHNGLDIIVKFENYRGEDALTEARGLVNQVLDVTSFITMAYCEIDRINSQIEFDIDGASKGELSVISDSDFNLSVPRSIDKGVFSDIFSNLDKLGKSYRDGISRALAWSRISILQKQTTFEFICLWIAIETINNMRNKNLPPIKGKKYKRENHWRGIFDIVNKKVFGVDFNGIIDTRVHIFHSLGDITTDFINKMVDYIEPMRKIITYGIGIVLGLDEKAIETIARKRPLKVFAVNSAVYGGRFENLKGDIEWLIANDPKFIVNINQWKYHLNDEGNPEADISLSTTARFADGVKFNIEYFRMSGEKNAGVKQTTFKINN